MCIKTWKRVQEDKREKCYFSKLYHFSKSSTCFTWIIYISSPYIERFAPRLSIENKFFTPLFYHFHCGSHRTPCVNCWYESFIFQSPQCYTSTACSDIDKYIKFSILFCKWTVMYNLTLKFLTVHFKNQNSNFDIHINVWSSGCITMRAIQNEWLK